MKYLSHLFLSATFLTLLFSGCATQPAPQAKVQIDPTLPTVSVNGYIADMNAIAFEWKPIEDERVVGYYIYRSMPEAKESDNKLHRLTSIENRYSTHYVDTDVKPGMNYLYRFSSFNTQGHESQPSKTIQASTKALFPSVSYFKSVGNLPRMAKLLWRPHTNIKVNRYILERSTLQDPKWEEIATIEGRLQAEYIDSELEDNSVYKYRLLSVTYDGVVSTPSDIAKVITKPLPHPIKNLKASSNLPKKITISWDPSEIADFSHYNIYRSSSADGHYEYYVKSKENSFIDTLKEDGVQYFYKVSAVDKDGLESKLQDVAVAGSTLTKPQTPSFLEASLQDNKVQLSWQQGDSRNVSYVLVKTTQLSWLKKSEEEIVNISTTHYVDINLKPHTLYSYQIIGVDEYGIRSNASKPVEIETEELGQ